MQDFSVPVELGVDPREFSCASSRAPECSDVPGSTIQSVKILIAGGGVCQAREPLEETTSFFFTRRAVGEKFEIETPETNVKLLEL